MHVQNGPGLTNAFSASPVPHHRGVHTLTTSYACKHIPQGAIEIGLRKAASNRDGSSRPKLGNVMVGLQTRRKCNLETISCLPRRERLLLHRDTVRVRRYTVITFICQGAREQPKTRGTHYVHTEYRLVRHQKPRAVFCCLDLILDSVLKASLEEISLCTHFTRYLINHGTTKERSP